MPSVEWRADRNPEQPSRLLNFTPQLVSTVLVGLALLGLTVVLVPQTAALDAGFWLVWLICSALLTFCIFLAGPIEEGLWAGYLNLVTMVAWLTTGWVGALAAVVVGVAFNAGIRLRIPYDTANGATGGVLHQASGRLAISAASLLVAVLAYTLLGGRLPLRTVQQTDVVPLAAALLSGLLATQAAGHWLVSLLKAPVVKPIWSSTESAHLLWELALLPASVVIALIPQSLGLLAFLAIMILPGVNAYRLRQLAQAARQSARLYIQSTALNQSLSIINHSVQTVLFNLNSEEAMKAACESALAVSEASKAAIFVVDPDRKQLQLIEQVGLTEAHRQRVAVSPYEVTESAPRVVNDTKAIEGIPLLAERARIGEYRAYAEMPLRSGHVILGYLTVYHDEPRFYRKTELDLLEILANQVTAALDNAQLLRALELYAFEMTQLVHLSRISAASLDVSKLVANIPETVRHMMSANHVTMALYNNGGGQIQLVETTSSVEPPVPWSEIPEIQSAALLSLPRRQTFQPGHSSAQLATFLEQQELGALILVPVLANQALLGVIMLGRQEPRVYSEREWQLIETAANQIAAQISNAQTYSATHAALNRRLDQLSVIEEIVRQISGMVDLNHIISVVLEAAMHTTRANLAALAMLTDADEFWIIFHRYVNGKLEKHYLSRPKDQGVIGEVTRTGGWVLVPDNRKVPYYITSFPDTYLSSLGVPLIKDNTVQGVLYVESEHRNYFTEEQASFLKNLAGHAVISIENARLVAALQYQVITLISLRELSLHLSSAIDTQAVANAVLATALAIFQAKDAAIFSYNSATSQLTLLESMWSDSNQHTAADMQLLEDVALHAVRTGEIHYVENLQADTAPPGVSYQAFIAVPIKRSGQVREIMCVAFAEPQVFEDSELNTMHLLASQAAGHLENAILHEQIRDNNDQMQAILDSTRDGVILLDRDGRLAAANPSAQSLLGLTLSDYIGEHFAGLLLKHVDTEEAEAGVYSREEATALGRLLRLEPERITNRQFERKTSKGVIYIEEIGSPVVDEHSQIVGRLLTLRDITDQKLLEQYRDDITQMAVHDLRGPLGAIISALNLTLESLEEEGVDSGASLTIGLAQTSAQNLLNLVDTMMDIAKMERRALPLRRERVSVGQLIENAFTVLAPSIQKAGVTVDIRVPADLPLANVDPEKVQRVLINLLDNASRYTPANGQILISAELLPKRHRIQVSIADSGPGIPEEEQQRIFQKFRQIESREPLRGHKGSGLGLTFCQLVVEAHGERIWVEEDSSLSGACFAFTLPLS